MNHTFILTKEKSNELLVLSGGRPKSEFIRDAVEEKMDRGKALRFLLEAQEEIVERTKLRLDQAVTSQLDEVNRALLGSMQALSAMSETSDLLTDEVNDLRRQCKELSAEVSEAKATLDQGLNLIGALIRDLNHIVFELTGASRLDASQAEQYDSGASGNSEVFAFTSAPKRG